MKGINTPGQALDSGGVASFSAPRDGVSHLAFPALARKRNHHADSFPLAPLGNEKASNRYDCLPMGDARIELATSTMSTWHSPAELTARVSTKGIVAEKPWSV